MLAARGQTPNSELLIMFLFLSKLLPLFVYPLGLACLLLVVALGLWWKQVRWTPIAIVLALGILLLASNRWVSDALVASLEWQYRGDTQLPAAEAIVLLGGATQPAAPPRPGVDLRAEGDRVLYAADLYLQGKAPVIIAAGGRIDWSGQSVPESADMATLLVRFGVPPQDIIEEPDSLNTYENAVNVRRILEQRQIQKILLVTSAIHMPRSLLIFRKQEIDTIPAPTDFYIAEPSLDGRTDSFQDVLLSLLPSSDRLERTTRALKEYIGMGIYRLRGWL